MSKKYKSTLYELEKTQNIEELVKKIEFLSKLNANFEDKIISDMLIERIKNNDFILKNLEYAESLNFKNCVKNDTKIIIVGTITPWNGTELGYFYTSNRNKVYRILDDYFENTRAENSLVILKKQLASKTENSQREIIIKEIQTILTKYKVAFLDVIKSSIRQKQNARDDKILMFNLDFESFSKLNYIEKFICTSKNTKKCLELIFDSFGYDKSKIVVCNQGWPQYRWEIWKDELDKVYKK